MTTSVRHSALHHAGPGKAVLLAVLALLLALPFAAKALGLEFYIGVATRVLIFAIAASSLNLILGFGGMVSFGHAAFVGLGAYTVGILMDAGVGSAWVSWPLAMLVSAAAAALIGAISLRTRGVYFIMITLAFAQMFYYIVVSLKAYGGDDGLPLTSRSLIASGLDLKDDAHFYWVVLALCVAVMGFLQRCVNSSFGRLLQGTCENEMRMAAVGTRVFLIRWQAFVLAGALAGLAGALLANLNGLVTPHLMHWTQSGQLMIMVIIGGAGALWGGLLGAAGLLILEELLSSYTLHWHMALGVVLLAVVLFAPKGLSGLRKKVRRQAKEAVHG
nr:branched-chain amino acid ABC transporter permease [uncultured Roseateles sp.]